MDITRLTLSNPDDRVILVKPEDDQDRTFQVHMELLCNGSNFINVFGIRENAEFGSCTIDIKAEIFAEYMEWLYTDTILGYTKTREGRFGPLSGLEEYVTWLLDLRGVAVRLQDWGFHDYIMTAMFGTFKEEQGNRGFASLASNLLPICEPGSKTRELFIDWIVSVGEIPGNSGVAMSDLKDLDFFRCLAAQSLHNRNNPPAYVWHDGPCKYHVHKGDNSFDPTCPYTEA